MRVWAGSTTRDTATVKTPPQTVQANTAITDPLPLICDQCPFPATIMAVSPSGRKRVGLCPRAQKQLDRTGRVGEAQMDFSAVSILVAIIYAVATAVPALVKYAITRRLTRARPPSEVLKSLPAILQAVDSPNVLTRLGNAVRRRPPRE